MYVELWSLRHQENIRLPADSYEIRDVLDKLRMYEDPEVCFARITECSEIKELEGFEFRDIDVYLLNQLAKRIEQLDTKSSMQNIQMRALIMDDRKRSLTDLIKMTYTDCLPVYPCKDHIELGETAIDNDWLEEIKDIPDEALPYIDRYEVGKAVAEREGGFFVDKYYCLPSNYEEPDMDIAPDKPDGSFFRLLIAPKGSDAYEIGRWIALPQETGKIGGYASELNMQIDDLAIYDFRSALPKMQPPGMDISHAYVYQILANKLTDHLKYNGIVRLKAVMETKPPMTPDQLNKLIDDLPRYDFNGFINTVDLFGYEYIAANLPQEFDALRLIDINLTEIGETILKIKDGHVTSYGTISGIDQKLFSVVVKANDQEETEDESDDEDMADEEETQMGGMIQ